MNQLDLKAVRKLYTRLKRVTVLAGATGELLPAAADRIAVRITLIVSGAAVGALANNVYVDFDNDKLTLGQTNQYNMTLQLNRWELGIVLCQRISAYNETGGDRVYHVAEVYSEDPEVWI